MEHLFWKGRNLDKRNRILILGESHYGDDLDCIGKDTPEDYSIGVMKCFLEADERSYWHLFFERIARSFGYSERVQMKDFYNKVCFGNYSTKFCYKDHSQVAQKDIAENRVEYNNRLFKYVNENDIGVIVCFSKLVYWNLPERNDKDESFEAFILSPPEKRRRLLEKHCYAPRVEHGKCDVTLDKPLMVYGINHPTGSFGYRDSEVFGIVKNQDILRNLIFNNENIN